MKYITKSDISQNARFGSQMAQYASLYAISKKINKEIIFHNSDMNRGYGVELFDAFDLNTRVVEDNIEFSTFFLINKLVDDRVFNLDPNKNWDIRGLFHSYKYFNDFEQEIKQIFSFKDEIVFSAKENINKIRNLENYPLVSLHVRRGDYLQVSSLNLSNLYYETAFQKILNSLGGNYFKLLIFSDDIPWCKDTILGENVFYIENNSHFVDMCMMSMCDHNIIANSSFSWWGAYLNKSENKKVICPDTYIGNSSPQFMFINGNYYPSSWTAISEI